MEAFTFLTLAALLVAGADALPAAAQDRQTPPDAILDAYVASDVRITSVSGIRLDGALAAIHEGQVEILTKGGTRTIPLDSIIRIERHGDSLKDGFIAGAIAGGVLGFLACFECEGAGIRIYAAAVSATVYGLAGAGIDAMHDGWTPLYVRKDKAGHGNAGSPRALVRLRVRF